MMTQALLKHMSEPKHGEDKQYSYQYKAAQSLGTDSDRSVLLPNPLKSAQKRKLIDSGIEILQCIINHNPLPAMAPAMTIRMSEIPWLWLR